MRPLRPRLAGWWMQRSPRERVLLLGLGVLASAYVAVTGVAQPLLAARADALATIALHDAALVRLAALPAKAQPEMPAAATGRPVSAIATETAPAFDLTIRRIEPEGDGARLVVEDAEFSAILLWIEALEGEHGLRLAAIEMDRRPEPGVVSAQMSLER